MDENIIVSVKQREENESDEDSDEIIITDEPIPSTGEALNAIHCLRLYCSNC